ncbi:MAG: hypothetical protein PHG85_04870 [Candidatus Altiarchaeota archaeon]|nr:hypothetical protein [Candidatus Altiarchaeota archaeon]
MSVVREVCRIIDVKYELMITVVFAVISGSYLLYRHGVEELIDTLMHWMFPASMMIFITLVFMLLLEKVYLQR